ncbi:MAG: DUF1015 family protein, partial [Bacteroidota bacterium]
DTLQRREKLFADYLHTVGFNAEPVLITYVDNPQIDGILRLEVEKTPEYDFTTTDKIRHQLWIINIGYQHGLRIKTYGM